MQTSSVTLENESEYVAQDDESEAQRFQDIRGVGEVNYLDDEEVRHYSMEDFGLSLDSNVRNDSQ